MKFHRKQVCCLWTPLCASIIIIFYFPFPLDLFSTCLSRLPSNLLDISWPADIFVKIILAFEAGMEILTSSQNLWTCLLMQQLYYNFNVFIYRGENERVCVYRRKMEQKREERWGDKEWNREERLQNITGSRLLFMEFDAKGESSPTVFERSVDVDDSIFFFLAALSFTLFYFWLNVVNL